MEEAKVDERYLILSDIHGNVSAFDAVMDDCKDVSFAGILLLGDLIDYGMRSNEIIQKIEEVAAAAWKDRILVNIWGNHEKLVVDKDLERLSSDRGRGIAKYTADHLSDASKEYILKKMNRDGIQESVIGGFKLLAVHGSLEDHYWKAIGHEDLRGCYEQYDIVLGGHSHYSHCFTHFYPGEYPDLRNKKAVTFINPGSVGQPRNQNPCAQYAILGLPSKRVELRAVEYDIGYEQSLFPDEVDAFYRDRLTRGI